jgi:hypothetical protein
MAIAGSMGNDFMGGVVLGIRASSRGSAGNLQESSAVASGFAISELGSGNDTHRATVGCSKLPVLTYIRIPAEQIGTPAVHVGILNSGKLAPALIG